MDKFFNVMERPFGRALRVVLGIGLVYFGIGRIGATGGRILALAGLLPIAMGLWGPCLAHVAVRRFKRVV